MSGTRRIEARRSASRAWAWGPSLAALPLLLGLAGPGTMFEGESGHDLASIPDGADSTLLVVEAAEVVPWTRPVDLVYDPKGPLPRLGGHFKDGSLALFAEGSVAFIKDDIDEPT